MRDGFRRADPIASRTAVNARRPRDETPIIKANASPKESVPAMINQISPNLATRRFSIPPWTTADVIPTNTNIQATFAGVKPNLPLRNCENVASKLENAVAVKRDITRRIPTTGRRAVRRMEAKERISKGRTLEPAGRVSGSLSQVHRNA